MKFNKHPYLEGSHAFLSASQYHWINYSPEKLEEKYLASKAAQHGTEIHDIAARLIKEKIKLPGRTKKTLNNYVNDAIGYGMTPEVLLYYSDNCYGTADTISFRKNFLRIHDLKTGVIPAHIEQLLIYAALFCLEYHVSPSEIKTELRIYQNDDIFIYEPTTGELEKFVHVIVDSDDIISRIRNQE